MRRQRHPLTLLEPIRRTAEAFADSLRYAPNSLIGYVQAHNMHARQPGESGESNVKPHQPGLIMLKTTDRAYVSCVLRSLPSCRSYHGIQLGLCLWTVHLGFGCLAADHNAIKACRFDDRSTDEAMWDCAIVIPIWFHQGYQGFLQHGAYWHLQQLCHPAAQLRHQE